MSAPPPVAPVCPRCRQPNEGGACRCPRCGQSLWPASLPDGTHPPANALFEALFPVRNIPALIAFWVCLFALIPGLGILVALAVIGLGVSGLRNARKDPAVGGRWQSWLSVAVAALFGLINIAVVGIAVYQMTHG